MDTAQLVKDIKARFNINYQKEQLREKYNAKLILADQGGLWKATTELLGFLASNTDEYVIIQDSYDNPIFVNRVTLHDKLDKVYSDTMNQWYTELKKLENNR